MRNSYATIIIITLFALGCSTEGTENEMPNRESIVETPNNGPQEENGSMTFTINGENRVSAVEVSPLAVFAEVSSKGSDSVFFAFGVSAAFVDDNLRRWSFNTSFSSLEANLITAGTTISTAEVNQEDMSIVGQYDESLVRIPENEILFEASHGEDLFYTLTISNINEENKTVTGTFALDVKDVSSDQIFEIRDGVFMNAVFTREKIVVDE